MDAAVGNVFELTASMDGTSYYSQIIPVGNTNGFFQFLDKATGKCTPPWDATSGPKFYQEVIDVDGNDYVPQAMPQLIWNGTSVSFKDGVSQAPWAGNFACKQESVTRGKTVKTRWVFQIIKDLFGAGNVDSDDFCIVSNIKDTSGNVIPVRSDPQKVECVQSASGTGVTVTFSGVNIEKGSPSTDLTAEVHTPTGQLNNATFRFYKVQAGDDKELVSGQNGYVIKGNVLTVPKDDVSGVAVYRAETTVSGKQYEGFASVKDLNDPYIIQITESHSSPDAVAGVIKKNDTVTYSGKVIDPTTDDEVSGYEGKVKFYTRDKNGTQVDDGASQLVLSFSKVVTSYGGKISGYAAVDNK